MGEPSHAKTKWARRPFLNFHVSLFTSHVCRLPFNDDAGGAAARGLDGGEQLIVPLHCACTDSRRCKQHRLNLFSRRVQIAFAVFFFLLLPVLDPKLNASSRWGRLHRRRLEPRPHSNQPPERWINSIDIDNGSHIFIIFVLFKPQTADSDKELPRQIPTRLELKRLLEQICQASELRQRRSSKGRKGPRSGRPR